jgi:hypothetical protein
MLSKLRHLAITVTILLIIFPVTIISYLAKPVFAQTFDPNFSVSVSSLDAGSESNFTGTFTQVDGEDLLRDTTINVPAGWDIADGTTLAQDEIVGGGTYFITWITGGTLAGDLTLKNDLTIRDGDKAHWVLWFDTALQLEVYVYGDILTGHTIEIVRGQDLPGMTAPSEFVITFYGTTASGSTVFTNPLNAGNYSWSSDMTSENGLTSSKSQIKFMPNSLTLTGDSVVVPLGDNVSVTYSSVNTEGQTSIATSETAPPEGTGQFQLSGDLYYDFDTTADINCPCIVTLPYDSATTPDPKIFHLEDSVWVDVTTNVTPDVVIGVVSSFSWYAPGQPDLGLEFKDPISALLEVSDPLQINRNRTLPVNFTLTDGNGFVARDDVEVQVIDTSNNSLVGEIEAIVLKNHYKANLNIKDLNLDDGTYQIRVKVGNTVYSPTIFFNPV